MADAEANRKAKFIRRLSSLKTERSSFVDHWRDIADHVLPRRGRFLVTDRNKGEKRNQKIIDNTATMAHRTLASGLMSGVTSPARPWFRLGTPDPMLVEVAPVKMWLADVERLMREVFNRSNVYNALFSVYEELAAFGTAAMIVYEDSETVIHCETLTAGEFYIAAGKSGRADTLYREYSMTVSQVVDEFGRKANGEIDWSNISTTTRNLYERGGYDAWVECLHVIEPNRGRDTEKLTAKNKAFRSVWMEIGGDDDKLLRESGFDDFPAMCPRWNLLANDIYGRSPAMDALGDVRQLQLMEKRAAQAIDKMVNPPLQGPARAGQAVNALPGGFNAVDNTQTGGIAPVYMVQPRTAELQQSMEFVRSRIRRAFYEDLWLIVTEMDRANVTATEIDARREEKLLMLGPVLERLHHELLDPLIDRVFNIMLRTGALPEPPEALSGIDLRVEYISMLAQAQRSVAVSGIERAVTFVSNLAQAKPEALDKIDFDQAIDEYTEALGTPARIVVPDDMVQQTRAARAKQQQQAEQMAAMQQAATTARDAAGAVSSMAAADMTGANALTSIIGGVTG